MNIGKNIDQYGSGMLNSYVYDGFDADTKAPQRF